MPLLQDTDLPGVRSKALYSQEGFSDRVWLEAWGAGTGAIQRSWPQGVEIFVLRGELRDESGVSATVKPPSAKSSQFIFTRIG